MLTLRVDFFQHFNFPQRHQSTDENKERNDSVRAKIAAVVVEYRLTPDYVLNEMNYADMIMYNAVIPGYGDESKTARR